MRASIGQWLSLSGFRPESFPGAEEALRRIGPDFPGIVISDIRMPGMDGMTLLKRLVAMDAGLPVVLITGHGDVPMAVEAMRLGAFDFLEKPFDPDHLTDAGAQGAEGAGAGAGKPGACATNWPMAARFCAALSASRPKWWRCARVSWITGRPMGMC
jgi:FixJ family two-component response regulator